MTGRPSDCFTETGTESENEAKTKTARRHSLHISCGSSPRIHFVSNTQLFMILQIILSNIKCMRDHDYAEACTIIPSQQAAGSKHEGI